MDWLEVGQKEVLLKKTEGLLEGLVMGPAETSEGSAAILVGE
jgi:hypothetical protein